ncbi:MAG: hypothetical protein ABR987_11940, partial [Terracidiphilus sp.]
MIPPSSIDRYPENTLEGLVAREWASMIAECEDHTIDLEPIQKVIAKSRALMRASGWPAIYEHNFLVQLRNDLTELTHAHPVTRQFIQLLII